MEVTAEKPSITQVKKVISNMNQDMFYKLPYKNVITKCDMIYTISSSAPEVIQPRLERLHFKPREGKAIGFFLPRQKKAGTVEAVVSLNGF